MGDIDRTLEFLFVMSPIILIAAFLIADIAREALVRLFKVYRPQIQYIFTGVMGVPDEEEDEVDDYPADGAPINILYGNMRGTIGNEAFEILINDGEFELSVGMGDSQVKWRVTDIDDALDIMETYAYESVRTKNGER